jgi:hypothetical protein
MKTNLIALIYGIKLILTYNLVNRLKTSLNELKRLSTVFYDINMRIFKIFASPYGWTQTNQKAFIKFILPFLYFLKANSRKESNFIGSTFLASFLLLQKHFNAFLEMPKCMGTS